MESNLFNRCKLFESIAESSKEIGLHNSYFNVIESAMDVEIEINNTPKIVVCSNNYLGLANHPAVKEASIKAIKKYGTSCTGSRLLNGTLDIHIEAEKKFAKLVGKEEALLFATGYQANVGVISALTGKNDLIFLDRLDHASIIDGSRLSLSKIIRFRHNSIEHLEELLEKNNNHTGDKLIIVDGVYSMDGDIAKLPELSILAKKYKAKIMIDDAHALGVLGQNGAGTAEYFGLENNVDIIVATASKSLASIGSFVAGCAKTIEYLKYNARSMIYSASLPAANVAAILASLDIIENEPERRQRLWNITQIMNKEFKSLGFNTLTSETPIIPIFIGSGETALKAWRMLFDDGIFVSCVVSPTVPEGCAILRTSYTSEHTAEHMDRILSAFKKVGKHLGII